MFAAYSPTPGHPPYSQAAWVAIIINNPSIPIPCKFYGDNGGKGCRNGTHCEYEHYYWYKSLSFIDEIQQKMQELFVLVNYNTIQLNNLCNITNMLSTGYGLNIAPQPLPTQVQHDQNIEPPPYPPQTRPISQPYLSQAPSNSFNPEHELFIDDKQKVNKKAKPFTNDIKTEPSSNPSPAIPQELPTDLVPTSKEPKSKPIVPNPPPHFIEATNIIHTKKSKNKQQTSGFNINPIETATKYRKKGNEWFKKGDYDKAINNYSEAIRWNAKDPLIFSNRSAAYRQRGRYFKAKADAQRCITLDPSFQKGYIRLAAVYILEKRYDLAADAYKQGLHSCLKTETLNVAIAALNKLTASKPEPPDPFNEFMKTKRGKQLKNTDYDEILKGFIAWIFESMDKPGSELINHFYGVFKKEKGIDGRFIVGRIYSTFDSRDIAIKKTIMINEGSRGYKPTFYRDN